MLTLSNKLATYRDAFTTKEQTDGKTIHILRDNLPEEIRDHLLDLIQQVNHRAGSLDLSYSIVRDAVALLPTNPDDLTEFDPYELNDIASIYTRDRLDYLTIQNQYDITQIIHEYSDSMDIADACAIWYDRQVIAVLSDLVDFFTR